MDHALLAVAAAALCNLPCDLLLLPPGVRQDHNHTLGAFVLCWHVEGLGKSLSDCAYKSVLCKHSD
jgi:hypothetical protein